MSVKREARFLSGTDIGRTIEPFVGLAAGGLSYKRTGQIIGVTHTEHYVEIYTANREDDPLMVDHDFLVTITGTPSDRKLEV